MQVYVNWSTWGCVAFFSNMLCLDRDLYLITRVALVLVSLICIADFIIVTGNEWCFRPRVCLGRLHCAVDNMGLRDIFCMNHVPGAGWIICYVHLQSNAITPVLRLLLIIVTETASFSCITLTTKGHCSLRNILLCSGPCDCLLVLLGGYCTRWRAG